MPTGTIVATGCSTPPSSEYLMCDGAPVSRSTYANLWNAIRAGHAGTAGDPAPYGNGNGTSTFNVPDLRGRVAVGAGIGVGLTARFVGGLLGSEAANMPSHSHGGSTGTANLRHVHGPSGQNNMDFVGNSGAGAQFELSFLGTQSNQGVAWGGVTGGADVEMIHGHSITGAGGGNDNFGQPVNNLPPSQVVNYMIKV
jgi:microcystin-dependent protein